MEICVIYNRKIISDKEVKNLIQNERYDCDDRLIVTTPTQADIIKGALDDEVLNMYEYKVYKPNEMDCYTMGYVFSRNEESALETVSKEFPNDKVEVSLETELKQGTMLMGVRLES